MTNPNRSAHEIAAELEQSMFRLYDQDNQPDVEWTEDGPQWGITFHSAEASDLAPVITVAEMRLDAFLREHRPELGDMPHWQHHYAEIDQLDSGFEQQRADGAAPPGDRHPYMVGIHDLTDPVRPGVKTWCFTRADAYLFALDHFGTPTWYEDATDPIIVTIHRAEADIPLVSIVGQPVAVADHVRHYLREHAAVCALVLARSMLQQWRTAHRSAAAARPGIERWLAATVPGSPDTGMPLKYLVARWAVAEVAVTSRPHRLPNRWDEQLRQADVDPGRVRALSASVEKDELNTAAWHPEITSRDNALRSLLSRHTEQLIESTGIPAVGAYRSSDIRHLLDATQAPEISADTTSEASFERTTEPTAAEIPAPNLEL